MKLRLLIFFWLALASPASAHVGLPMIVLTIPGMLIALIPIILIESYFIRKRCNLSYSRSLKLSSVANAVSTIIGIPITWFLFVVLEILLGLTLSYLGAPDVLLYVIQAPWLLSATEGPLGVVVPAAQIVMLIPYFYASWFIEVRIVRRIEKKLPSDEIKQALFKANLTTYALLGILLLLVTIYVIVFDIRIY